MELLRNTRQIHCKAIEQRATLIHRQYNRDWGTSYSRPPIDPYLTSPLLQNPGGATVSVGRLFVCPGHVADASATCHRMYCLLIQPTANHVAHSVCHSVCHLAGLCDESGRTHRDVIRWVDLREPKESRVRWGIRDAYSTTWRIWLNFTVSCVLWP